MVSNYHMSINRILFQNLRDGFNTKHRSKRLENITKEFTTAEANLETFIALTQHVRSNHNTELKVPDKEVEKDKNNCRADIIVLKFDDAKEKRAYLKVPDSNISAAMRPY